MWNWRANLWALSLAAGAVLVGSSMVTVASTPPAGDRGSTATATAPAARALIEKQLQEVEAVLRDAKLAPAEKTAKVRAIAEATIDFETMGRLAMGANWRDLSDAKRSEFTQEFRQHVINTYGHFVEDYTNQDLVVVGDNAESRGDWTVETKIMGDKDGVRKELAKVDYRLRPKDGQWKIIDVTIEGVSMMANFRAQFQDIMTSGGIDKLLKLLREKNAAGAAAPTGKSN